MIEIVILSCAAETREKMKLPYLSLLTAIICVVQAVMPSESYLEEDQVNLNKIFCDITEHMFCCHLNTDYIIQAISYFYLFLSILRYRELTIPTTWLWQNILKLSLDIKDWWEEPQWD